ncbi:MAG TPA: class I SAM-dependent methyltransferase, partial [Candidatus Baltobacteraceae bacterium]|nr:class I SAM-dependent methyltransferase [Candidatus Baltobacteraceae bacterium]
MTARSEFLDPKVARYILDTMTHEHPVLRALRDVTQAMPNAQMQIGADQGEFMQLLARLLPVRRYLEIGVFTGYSSLALALALPEDGRIVACDVSDEYTTVARRYWREAGVEAKIDLRLAPALETLRGLVENGESETFDLAFIDADKENVDGYYEYALRLLRRNGVILV